MFLCGFLAANASAALLKPVHSCYNTGPQELGNVAFGKAGNLTDDDFNTGQLVGSGITIDLNDSYNITSHYIRALTTVSGCADTLRVSGSNDNLGFTTLFTTDSIGFSDQLGELENTTPYHYRYWKFERTNNCPTTTLQEVRLNATPQTCYSDYFQLVNYTNSSNWMGVYAEYSLNQTSNNRNRIVLEENSTGNITEIENKFKDYDVQYPLVGHYNSTLDGLYSVHKTSNGNGNCRDINVKKITLSTHLVNQTFAKITSEAALDPTMTGGFGAGSIYIGASKLSSCPTGLVDWRIHKIDLITGSESAGWLNDSQIGFNAHNYFVPSEDVLLFPFEFEGNVHNKSYIWGVNSSDGFSGGPLYSSVGRDSQAYFVDAGKKVVFSSNQTGNYELYLIPATCANACTPVRLTSTGQNESILSVLDSPERNSFIVAYRTLEDYYNVYGEEFHLVPFSSSTSVNSTAAGKAALFTAFWEGANSLSRFIFSTNNSGAWVNYTPESFTGAQNWSNYTLALNATPQTIVGWRFYANDSNGNFRKIEGALSTTDQDAPFYSNPTYNSTRAGESVRFAVDWGDNYNLSNYTFSFDNGTGTLANDSATAFSGVSAVSEVVKIASSLAGTVVRWIVYAYDAAGNFNATPIQSLTTTESTPPQVNLTQISATKAFEVFFNFTASDASGLYSATLYANFSGSWNSNSTNSTSISSGLQGFVSASGIAQGIYAWNILVCDTAGNCAFASSNSSVSVDRTAPNASAPTVQAASSTQATVSWTAQENATGIVEYWTGASATPINASNSSTSKATAAPSITLSSLVPSTAYFYRTWTCDEAGNCAASSTNSFSTSSSSKEGGNSGSGSSSGGGGPGGFSFSQQAITPKPAPDSSGLQSGEGKGEKLAQASNAGPATTRQAKTAGEVSASPTSSPKAIIPSGGAQVALNPEGRPPGAFTGLALANISLKESAFFAALVLLGLAFAAWRFSKKGVKRQEAALQESPRPEEIAFSEASGDAREETI